MKLEDRDEDSPRVQRGPARVHIYGAGVAGMTAAHELAIRGFRVRILECAREHDETGRLEGSWSPAPYRNLAVGGMARTQYLRADKGAPGNFSQDGSLARCDEYRLFYEYPESFEPSDRKPVYFGDDDERLYHFMAKCGYFRTKTMGVLYVRAPLSQDAERNDRRVRHAWHMRGYLIQHWELDPSCVSVIGPYEAAALEQLQGSPLPPLEDRDGLLVLELQHFLPGEHGFRFFPSYYRHLFSTMVETPILDVHGQLTNRRVYDNLEPSSFYGIASQGRRIRFLRRAPATRPVEMLQELADMSSSGYPPGDSLQFTLRLWRYMCTCSERRKDELEDVTWWEYLEGLDRKTGQRRYHYSDTFKKDMQFAPRVLAAFDGAWGDARTNGNTLVQLYLNNLLPMPKTDGTLNGPTTQAWLRPWRRYLEEYLGVEFREGRLTGLALDPEEGELVAWWNPQYMVEGPDQPDLVWNSGNSSKIADERVDYYLVATDAPSAEAVTLGLPEVGVIQGLRGFTTWVPPNPRGHEPKQKREEGVLPGHVPWDRFQTLTGIQFFFPSSVRLAEGYIYFLDATWGLSAINSQQYWTSSPTINQDGFGAVLSVDIGNWYVREQGQPSPSGCSPREIAHQVWEQIRKATELHDAPLPQSVEYGFKLPEPAWYHVDRYLRFGRDAAGRERPVDNRAPYLIPIVGDWDKRPGSEPWDPLEPSRPAPATRPQEGVWQASHGGYPVHWKKLVFAGTYLKTFTRMTTMESANESARHAVNAIIDHYLTFRHGVKKPSMSTADIHARAPAQVASRFSGQGTLTGSPEFRMTPVGEYCRIWDPEKHELPELAPLRELDAKLFAQGLPHVWDVLHLEPLALPLIPSMAPQGGAGALKDFLGRVREGVEAMLRGVGNAGHQ